MAIVIKTTWTKEQLWPDGTIGFGNERYKVGANGTVVGLSADHRHFEEMVRIFDLTVESISVEKSADNVEEAENA